MPSHWVVEAVNKVIHVKVLRTALVLGKSSVRVFYFPPFFK